MAPSLDFEANAFRTLRSRLSRRRLDQIDVRLRLELLALGLLLTGFIFWQTRLPFANLHAQGRSTGVLTALTITWVAMAMVMASFVAVRHASRLRAGPPGPAWLSLPITPRALRRHLAWDSSVMAVWMIFPAAGVWSATLGLVPFMGLLALTPLMAGLLVVAVMGGAWMGERLAVFGSKPARPLPLVDQALTRYAHRSRRRRLPRATWRRRAATWALVIKDLRLTGRVPDLRRQLVIALAAGALSVAVWRLPEPSATSRPLDYALAFLMALLCAAAFGEWLVRLAGSDPFAVLRSLPLGLRQVWGGRAALALAGTLVLTTAQAGTAHLSPVALRVFLVWIGAATLAIAMLAVNYGVTLFPRSDVAQRLFGLSLGLAVIASLMIPLLGWLVLLSAVIHSARRLPGWARLEET